jgi:hypothetical protein
MQSEHLLTIGRNYVLYLQCVEIQVLSSLAMDLVLIFNDWQRVFMFMCLMLDNFTYIWVLHNFILLMQVLR